MDTKALRGDVICPKSHIASQCTLRMVITPSPNIRLNHVKLLLFVSFLNYKNSTFLLFIVYLLGTKPYARHLGTLWGQTQTLPSWSWHCGGEMIINMYTNKFYNFRSW